MIEPAVLLKEIDALLPEYLNEVVDFVGYLRQKKQGKGLDETGAYKEMAADIEREQEAHEWCGAYFGPMFPAYTPERRLLRVTAIKTKP